MARIRITKLWRLTVGAALLFTAPLSYGLGLGELKVDSNLNEPFRGRIHLLSADNEEELKELSIGLADVSEFDRAGIPYPLVLGRLRFRLSHTEQGEPYIRAISTLPIGEPYLQFIVELHTKGRQLFRQYTVLLDPPGPYQRKLETPAVPASSFSGGGMGRAGGAERSMGSGETYGPTRRSETLWSIAAKLRPDDSISMQQMMLSIQQANPQAFEGGNINRLISGVVLNVPSLDQIRAISTRDAMAEIRRQNAEAGTGGGYDSSSSNDVPNNSDSEQAGSDEMGRGAQGRSRGGENPVLAQENNQLRERIAILEQDLQDMREYVQDQADPIGSGGSTQLGQQDRGFDSGTESDSVKSGSMAGSMDGSMAGTEQDPKGMDRSADQTGSLGSDRLDQGAGQVEAQNTGVLSGGSDSNTGQGGQLNSDKALSDMAAEKAKAANAKKDAKAKTDKKKAEQVKANDKKPAKPRPKVVPPPEPVDPLDEMLGDVLNDPVTLGGVGGALIALLALVAVAARRKKKNSSEDDDMDLQDVADLDIGDLDAFGSDESSASTGSGDDLSAAEVYMNNGRYQQAEEILTRALAASPQRDDLKQKLLEVYVESGNRTAFESLAHKIHMERGGDDPLWDQVAEMGRSIAPDNPLFKKEGSSTAGSAAAAGAVGVAAAAAASAGASSGEIPDMLDLSDLGLDDGDLDVGQLSDGDDSVGSADLDVGDLDLGDLSLGGGSSDGGDELLGDGLDLDGLDSPSLSDAALANMNAGSASDSGADNGVDLDLGDIDLGDMGTEMSLDSLDLSADSDGDELDFGELSAELGLDLDTGADLGGDASSDSADLSLEAPSLDMPDADDSLGELGGLDISAGEPVADLGLGDLGAEDEAGAVDLDAELSAEMLSLDDANSDALSDSLGELNLDDDSGLDLAVGDASALDIGASSSDDFDLDGLDLSLDDGDEATSSAGDASPQTDVDPLSETMILDGLEFATGSSEEEGGEMLAPDDEASTKLDLAKAYIDMGDPEGARSMLNEVLLEGNDDQKNEARTLASELN